MEEGIMTICTMQRTEPAVNAAVSLEAANPVLSSPSEIAACQMIRQFYAHAVKDIPLR